MTEDRDSGEEPHTITHEEAEEIIASLSSVLETPEGIGRDADKQKEETGRRDISRAADPHAGRSTGTGGRDMSAYPIDRIPDEDLPRLVARLRGCGIVLATLADCAPFMTTLPLDADELWRVLTRLLMVPGGPLVASDGTLVAPYLTDLLWHVAARSEDTATLADISLVAVFADGMGYVNPHHAKQRMGFEALCALAQAYRLRWWPHARRLLETAARRNCGDAMLAGAPEGGEP